MTALFVIFGIACVIWLVISASGGADSHYTRRTVREFEVQQWKKDHPKADAADKASPSPRQSERQEDLEVSTLRRLLDRLTRS